MDFAVPADHWVKLKESEKKNKYLGLAREVKKLWNMKVTSIYVIGALCTVTKGLVKVLEDLEIRGRVETIQTTVWLTSARILRRVQETCCHLDFSERPSPYVNVENSQEEEESKDEGVVTCFLKF